MLHVSKTKVVGPFQRFIAFSNGHAKTLDVRPLLAGPIFEPLPNPQYYAKVAVDPICKTVVWPSGADIPPEALYELEPCPEPTAR